MANQYYLGESLAQLAVALSQDIPTLAAFQQYPQSSIIAASPSVSTVETYITAPFKIPAGTLVAGNAFRISLFGQGTSSVVNTWNVRVRLGTGGVVADTAILSPGATTAAAAGSNIDFRFDFIVTVRSIGASGSAHAWGDFVNAGATGLNTNANMLLYGSGAVTTINTLTDLFLGASWVSAAATTSAVFQAATVECIR